MNFDAFELLVEANHGNAKDFNQLTYLKRFGRPESVYNGVCRALSVAYLVKNHDKTVANQPDRAADFTSDMSRDLVAQKFFAAFNLGRKELTTPMRDLSVDEKKRQVGRAEWIARTHFVTKWPREATLTEAPEFERHSTQTAMDIIAEGRMRFQMEDRISFPDQKASANQFPDRLGFWYINTGGHAVALCFRNKEGAEKAKFFDPNLGQATFASYVNCRNFLNVYLKDQYPGGDFYVQEFA